MSRLFLDPLRAGLQGMLCSISPALWAVSLWRPQVLDMLVQAAGAAAAPSSDFGDALKNAMRDAAH